MAKLLTVREVAQILNCSTSTIYGWTETGKISFRKINGLLRFDSEEITAFIDNSKRSKLLPKIKIKPAASKKHIDRMIEKTIADAKNKGYNSPKGEAVPIQTSRKGGDDEAL